MPDYDKEDIDAAKGPGIVQSMLDMKDENDSDSNSDEKDEVEILKAKLEKDGFGSAFEKRSNTAPTNTFQLVKD